MSSIAEDLALRGSRSFSCRSIHLHEAQTRLMASFNNKFFRERLSKSELNKIGTFALNTVLPRVSNSPWMFEAEIKN